MKAVSIRVTEEPWTPQRRLEVPPSGGPGLAEAGTPNAELRLDRAPLSNLGLAFLMLALLAAGCGEKPAAATNDPHLTTNGTVEVTAKLVEIPDGAIFKRDLYDYATILKYELVAVHRGAVEKGATIFVGHYNPWKPRSEASDRRVKVIGGNLRQFQAGQTHHLALEAPIEDHFMGGIVNKYFGRTTNAIFWAVWTDLTANP